MTRLHRSVPRRARRCALGSAAAVGLLAFGCSSDSGLGKQVGSPSLEPDASTDAPVGSGGVENGGATGSGGSAGAAGGIGGTSGSGGGGTEPGGNDGGVKTLPPRPAWHPSFPLAEGGWRESTVPFCSEIVANLQPRIWSNRDAVYASVWSQCAGERTTCNTDDLSTERLYRNDGTGWKVIYEESEGGPVEISGYPDGRVVLGISGDCAVREVAPDTTTKCLWSDRPFSPNAIAVSSAKHLFVTGSYLDASETFVLLDYDGANWSTIKTWQATRPTLAASPSAALVAGTNQFAWLDDLATGKVSALPNVPAGDYGAGWVSAPYPVVLGDAAGRLVTFDGMQWKTTDTSFQDWIQGMWGAADGTLFAYAQAAFGRFEAKGGGFTTIFDHPAGDFPEHYFADIWGNSATEVFLAVNDNNFKPYACGTTFLVWFDGEKFHQF